jgi:GNAT superfamily N-acetyltransferase
VEVRPAAPGDVDAVVRLAAARRAQYETYQPVFWRPAADAAARQRPYLAGLIDDPAVISLVAVTGRDVAGFAIATVAPAPPVYDPGGLTCMLDDFAVADPRDWPTVGVALLRAVSRAAQERGAAQVVVVTAQLDEAKRAVLAASGLSVASEWWVRPLNAE